MQVLGAWRGVCQDARLGGLDSNQLLAARREAGLSVVSYRRTLASGKLDCSSTGQYSPLGGLASDRDKAL